MRPIPMLLCVLLCGAALAQPAPVEIPLLPPSAESWDREPVETWDYRPQPWDVELDPGTGEPAEPQWKPPALSCHLCGEDRGDGSCGCQRLLTQDLADLLRGRLSDLVGSAFSGKLELQRPVPVKVVSRENLQSLGGQPTLGLYQDGVIYLSQDLSRREGLAVLAHEYGHAWHYQHRQDIDRVESLLFEGFAEWVSYRVLAEAGDQRGMEEVLHDASVYGRGARWYLALEKELGLEAALDSARRRSSM